MSRDESLDAPDMSGILVHKKETTSAGKKSSHNWKTSFAKISQNEIQFYHSEKDSGDLNKKPEETISINNVCTVDIALNYTKKPFVFRIRTSDMRQYLLQAPDRDSMLQWIRAVAPHPEHTNSFIAKVAEQSFTEPHHKGRRPSEQRVIVTDFSTVDNSDATDEPLSTDPSSLSPQLASRQHSTTVSQDSIATGTSSIGKSKKGFGKKFGGLFKGNSKPSIGEDDDAEAAAETKHTTQCFGVDLEEYLEFCEGRALPEIMEKCIAEVEARGMTSLGIYRVSGNNADVMELKRLFNLDAAAVDLSDPKWDDINSVAGVFKLYLRELPDPLMTDKHYRAFLAAYRHNDYNERLYAIKDVLAQLPRTNLIILKYLAEHLARVAQYELENKMAISNLAIVFGPTICRPSVETMSTMMVDMNAQCGVVDCIIAQHDWLFADLQLEQSAESGDATAEGEQEQPYVDQIGENNGYASQPEDNTELVEPSDANHELGEEHIESHEYDTNTGPENDHEVESEHEHEAVQNGDDYLQETTFHTEVDDVDHSDSNQEPLHVPDAHLGDMKMTSETSLGNSSEIHHLSQRDLPDYL